MKNTLEVCAGSYQDCIAAYNGGATRVELNSALSVGGLSPSLVTLQQVKKDTNLGVICMVRPRAGGFCYDEYDFLIMMNEAELYLKNGADGIAFGFLNDNGTISVLRTKLMVNLIHQYGKTAVFHRAFDVTKDPYETIEQLIECNVDRLLTSGQKVKAYDGKDLIKDLSLKYGEKIQILAGSGINSKNAKEIIDYCKIDQVHSSCKAYKMDPTTSEGSVSYSYLSKPYENYYDIVSKDIVMEIVDTLK